VKVLANIDLMVSENFFEEEISSDRIQYHIKALEGVRHPLEAPDALEQAADYISGVLRSLGYDVADHCFPDNGRFFRNVIATKRGGHIPHERVVVLAHYDTVASSPGADNNASGVAVMLEIARLLAHCNFERTLHFIGVNLEENEHPDDPGSGTRGSRALAAYARENSWNIEGVLVLESVAYAGETVVQNKPAGLPVLIPKIGNFIAIVGNERSKTLIDRFALAVERYGVDLPFAELALPGNGELLPDSRRSDHASFWDEGYKAIMLTDTTNFRSPHYHSPSDTLETLNLEFAAKVCCACAGLTLDMARLTL
jgi:Zn-dependent M28 family amino/carboxypeptidase